MGSSRQFKGFIAVILLMIVGCVFLLHLCLDAGGETYIVAQDGSGDFETIQDAVNASGNGDVIRIHSGTYEEHVIVDRSISIIGNGPDETTLLGNGSGYGIFLDGMTGVLIRNLTLENYDTGIGLYESSENTITGVTAHSNNEYGIDIRQISDSNDILGCTAYSNNHGIYIYNSYSNRLSDNTAYDNSGNGITAWASDNILTDNTAYNNNVGIQVNLAQRNLVTHNNASNNAYAGMLVGYSFNNTISDNMLTGNSEGIRFQSNTRSNNATGNLISGNDEGIYIWNADNQLIFDNTITANRIGISMKGETEGNRAWNNNIFGNIESGIDAIPGSPLNATNNWWGDKTGPYHATNNTSGNGDNVTDFVEFDPWLEGQVFWPPVAFIDLITPDPAFLGDSILFQGHTNDESRIVRYTWRSSIDGEFYNGTEPDCYHDGLSLGEHTIFYRVQNDAGNWSQEISAPLVVTKRPVARIDSISPNPALAGEWVYFDCNGSAEVGSIHMYVWHSSIDGQFMSSFGNSTRSSTLSIGTHEIFFKVQDIHEVWSYEVSAELVIHAPPSAIIDSISPDYPTNEDEIQFTGNGTDEEKISRYAWSSDIDGEFSNGTEANITIPPGTLSLGTHNITLKVMDVHGVWSEEMNVTLIVHQRPKAFFNSISSYDVVSDECYTFVGNGTDDGWITYCSWRSSIDGELGEVRISIIPPVTHIGYIFSNIYASPWGGGCYERLSNGTHMIYLKVKDNLGVWSEEVNFTFNVNGRPRAKIVRVSPDPAVEGDEVTLQGLGIDDGSIVRYVWKVSDHELYNGTNASFTQSFSVVGRFTIHLAVQDDEGAWSHPVTTGITIERPKPDNVAPTVIITAPTGGDTMSGKVTITGKTSDEDGNITHVIITILGTTAYHDNITVDAGGEWSYEWNTTEWANDRYWITAQCFDGTDYSGLAHVNVTINNDGTGGGDENGDDDDDGFFSGVKQVVVIIAILAVTAFMIFFVFFKENTDDNEEINSAETSTEKEDEGSNEK